MMYNKDKPADNRSKDQSRKGRLVTFEGIDGSGKTTQIERLASRLTTDGYPVRVFREPGGTSIGEAIRRILLNQSNGEMCLETELLLFAAARAQLVREVILPEREAGQWIICDRFFDSTVAYQGYGRRLDQDMIRALNQLAVGPCKPDITILLDLPVEQALRRLSTRSHKRDRLDDESVSFMQRARDGYRQIAEKEPDRIVIIDASEPEEQIAEQIYRIIREGLGK